MVRKIRALLAGVGAFGAVVATKQYSEFQLKKKKYPHPIFTSSEVTTDVLIVGTGGAGLLAALRAKSHGLNPIIVEKSAKVGGTTSFSGGVMWIPNNGISDSTGDDQAQALTYLNNIIGDVGPVSSQAKRIAFLENGPKMVKWITSQGLKLKALPGYPDYFPELPGGKPHGGRNVEPGLYNRNLVGDWGQLIDKQPVRPPIPVFTSEAVKLFRAKTSWEGWWAATKVLTYRAGWERLMGRDPVTLGQSLVSQLLRMNLESGTPIFLQTKLKDLIIENGQVKGAIVEKDGKEVTIKTPNVILAAGGFARSIELRTKYQKQVGSALWTNAVPTDTGDALTLALKHGIATALLHGGWWGVTFKEPSTGINYWSLFERGLPHGIIVDSKGERYTNEAQSYNAIGLSILKHDLKTPAIPSALVIDSNHRNRYMLTTRYLPGFTPQSAIDSGFFFKADTIQDLAKQMGIPEEGLTKTVDRFNTFAENGVDEDFGRGNSAYDRYFGDPAYKNPNLGVINKTPFYGIKCWPGDLGTKGGILTDEYARALKDDGKVVEGLYAVGNSSASVMGDTYPGAGGTLGPAVTFAYVAAEHVANRSAKAS